MMKTVGIIGAMEEELEYISQAVQIVAKKEIAGMLFSVGKAGDKVAAAEAAAQALEMRYFLGRVGSGDQFVSSPKDKERIGRLVQATCVEMEGAAIAHACYLNHIPYVILRAISDMADGGAEVQYEDFMKDAARRAGLLIEEMLKRL